MKGEGNIRKLKGRMDGESAVAYSWSQADILDPMPNVDMDEWMGKTLRLEFANAIHCTVTGKKIRKTYGDGMSFDAFQNSPLAVESIIHPELSRIHEGIALRDKEWEEKHHNQPHVVYLSFTSGIKVGVTRDTNMPYRWIDQGAYNGNFSSINFYALGDGETIGLYYIDSITLAESDVDLVNVEEAAAQAFGFHPNPTSGQLRLSGVQTQTTLVVLDLMGREVLSESLDAGQQSVQLDLPEGVYLIGTDDQKNLRKLVIRR